MKISCIPFFNYYGANNTLFYKFFKLPGLMFRNAGFMQIVRYNCFKNICELNILYLLLCEKLRTIAFDKRGLFNSICLGLMDQQE